PVRPPRRCRAGPRLDSRALRDHLRNPARRRSLPAQRRLSSRKAGDDMMPLALRTSGIELSPALRKQIQTRMDRRLGKIAPHGERVTVRLEDTNGPRRGVDTVCRIQVVLSGLPRVLAHQKASKPETAFKRAAHRVEQAVKNAI